MKLGLFGIGSGPCSEPETAVAVAQAAEAAGYESLWTGEHVVLPDPQAPPSPAPPEFPMLHPPSVLSFLAGVTQRVRLGTGILLLPQRNPVVVAKELASVDVVSAGRLIFGLGVGYLEPEFNALGVPFAERGPRTDEYIEAIQALWTQDEPAYTGRFVSFTGIQAYPHPVQKPHPPIVVGGMSNAAFRRATLRGNGWYGFALDLERTANCIESLVAAATAHGRPDALGELEITVTPSIALDRDTIRRFEDLGVHRIVSLMRGRSRERILAFVDELASTALD